MARTSLATAFVFGCLLFSIVSLVIFFASDWKTSSGAVSNSNVLKYIRTNAKDPVHKLGVVVPFRDRHEALAEFVPYMWDFLHRQNLSFEIFVISQTDSLRFNRASLINVGFLLAVQSPGDCDYMVMHDVDLLPLNDKLSYEYNACADAPFHIAAPHLHPRYHYDKFIGGILMVTREQFEKVNGMSNKYYGWGWEDDEFYVRLKRSGYAIAR